MGGKSGGPYLGGKSLITGRRLKVCSATARAGAPGRRRCIVRARARRTGFLPVRDRAASALIVPTRHSASHNLLETGVSPVVGASPDEETSLKLDINSGLRAGTQFPAGHPRYSRKVSTARTEY